MILLLNSKKIKSLAPVFYYFLAQLIFFAVQPALPESPLVPEEAEKIKEKGKEPVSSPELVLPEKAAVFEVPALPRPLVIENQFPFFVGLMPPAIGSARTLRAGSYEVQLSADIASSLAGVQSGEEFFLIDGESHLYTLRFQQGLTKSLEWGLSLPYLSHQRGSLDPFIDDWHSSIGISIPKKKDVPHNQFRFIYIYDQQELLSTSESTAGFGNLSLMLGHQTGYQNLSVRAMLRLPSSRDSQSKLTGSEGTSGALWYSAAHILSARTLGGRWHLMHGLGFFWTNSDAHLF